MADDIVIVVRAEDNFSGVLGNFGSIITGVESAIRLAGDALRFFGDMALEGLDAIASYERMGASLETLVAKELLMTGAANDMTQALAMSSTQAEELLTWTQELAINSPFTTEGVNNAFRMAMAYGFTTDEAKRLTEAMIDFAAGSGATEASMEAIARALGQISATGKVTGGDMLQLVNAGLPVVEILAQGFGVTTEKLMEMRSDGLLPATEAIEYITQYLETNFAGAAERQATTWAGLQGTFADIKTMGLREFFGGMFDVLQPLAIELSNFLQTEGLQRLGELGSQIGQFTSNFINFAQQLQNMSFSDLTAMFSNWADSIDWDTLSQNIIDGIQSIDWVAVGAEIRKGLINIFNGLKTIVSEVNWAELIVALSIAFADLFAGILGYSGFRSMMIDFGKGIVEGIKTGVLIAFDDLLGTFDESLIEIINNVKNRLGISSPSSVFANIGRDIVMGLIVGWTGSVSMLFDEIGATIADIGALFGIDLGGMLGGTASLSTGSTTHAPGGGTSGGLSSGQVVNNYYGPVYFGATGEPNSYYDCPSPNPLVAASGNQLVVTGF